mmetsp:Transcript_1034/g.1938  ORF Transcript_1034/g.1938 Transcript_1034/m.1938 type:complete len:222 (-) Transcript_1034:1569-2234(-)
MLVVTLGQSNTPFVPYSRNSLLALNSFWLGWPGSRLSIITVILGNDGILLVFCFGLFVFHCVVVIVVTSFEINMTLLLLVRSSRLPWNGSGILPSWPSRLVVHWKLVHPAPQSSKEHLASSVLWTVSLLAVRSHSSSLHEFKIFTNLNRATSTVSNVIHDSLRCRCLRKGGLCSWKITARSSLADAMFASESRAPNLTTLVTTDLISFRQSTGLHLFKSQI